MSASYTPIPDVESGVATDGKTPTELAKEKYPEANDMEAEFLGKLDDAISNAKPEIQIPPVDAASLGIQADSPMAFVNALKIPTVCIVVLIVISFVIVAVKSAFLTGLYPYICAVALFAAAYPPTKGRFITQTGPAFDTIEGAQEKVDTEVGAVSGKALGTLNSAESTFNKAIAPIKDKLAYATKAENMLKKIDDSIDIPDTTDIERMFDGFEDQIKAAFDKIGGMVDIQGMAPAPFSSRQTLEYMALYPFLAIFIILQLLVTFLATLVLLVSMGHANAWELISFIILSYLTAILQVALAYLLTSAPMIASHINGFMMSISSKVNGSLDKSVGPVYKTVFTDGFGRIRDKMLELIGKMNKLEAPLQKLKDLPGVGQLAAGAEKLMENLPVKVPDMEDVKDVLSDVKLPKVKVPGFGGFGS